MSAPVRLTRRGRAVVYIATILGAVLFLTLGLVMGGRAEIPCTHYEDGSVSCADGSTYCTPGGLCDDSTDTVAAR